MGSSLASAQEKKIIAFGDSITQGLWEIQYTPNGARVGGYEPDLELLTDSIGDHHDVLNYGYGGETTQTGLSRFQNLMKIHNSAAYVLILAGTNDLWDGISRTATVWNLGVMIDKAREHGVSPVIGTLTPDTRPGVGSYKNIPAYNVLISDLAEQKNVPLTDFYTAMIDQWKSLYADGKDHNNGKGIDLLHPGREGYRKMAELWFQTLFQTNRSLPATYLLLL